MKCNRCGKNTVEAATLRHEISVGGAKFVGKLDGQRCASCKETEISLDVLTQFEHAVARSLAEHGPVSGATLRYMRKSVPLSAVELASLLRVAPETISRWETGERAVDRAAWLVVRALVLEPESMAALAELRDEPPARAVSIAV
ncbi:MAG TPA: helix-turn-helix domain-containing protein [Polyangiaceae bacterium]|nr:helix-turn-helix domain-containing protein [Polyangiaceae bacterium]